MAAGILEQIDARLAELERAVGEVREAVQPPAPDGADPSEWADGAMGTVAACAFLGIGSTELYALMGAGELPYRHYGVKRLLPRRALVRWLESRPQGRTP